MSPNKANNISDRGAHSPRFIRLLTSVKTQKGQLMSENVREIHGPLESDHISLFVKP